jgi:S-adenosylmethionine hydrolase
VTVPLVTLLTDFGAGSGYPAQMKAVILSAAPGAVIVDVSHDVPAYDVLAGALLLEACVPWFPPEAVHCAVVDPGVGTSRLPVAVVDASGRRFVGPDNGLFTPFLGPGSTTYELSRPVGAPSPRSATFHGRDLFAPVAAWLACGGDPARLGPTVDAPVRLRWPSARRDGDRLEGECLSVDAFGNVVTSILASDLGPLPREVTVAVAGSPARFVTAFGEGRPGELLALIGSSGRLEIAMREADAARARGLARGVPVVVRFG